MKTVTKSISLNEELAEFAKKQAQQGCYGNVSAYFADLLRKARQEQIDQDLKLLAEGVQGAPPEPSDDEVVAPIKTIRRHMQRDQWKPAWLDLEQPFGIEMLHPGQFLRELNR